MGATLSTLRKYVRAEINDPSPTEKMSSSTITHDGGNDAAFFQDQDFNFVNEGIKIGDVVINPDDGNSIAVIQQITNGGATNDKLVFGSVEGGTYNNYTNGDVVEIYDRHAQKGLNAERFTDTEVEDAIAQAQKVVAIRFGGAEKFDVKQDIEVMTKIELAGQTGTFSAGETVTGGDNSHAATVEYVGDTFIIVKDFITRVPIDNVTGTFKTGEIVTGSTNSYTGRVEEVNAAYLDLYEVTGEFNDNETLTGATTGATCLVNSASSYSSGKFASNETITGGTSSATGISRAAYSPNNFYVGQDLPTDLKSLIWARWWDGSQWHYLNKFHITEHWMASKASGDPSAYAVFDQKIWLWPNNSVGQLNELHLLYMAWDQSLSSDSTTTNLDLIFERLLVLESAKILAGQIHEEQLYARIVSDIQMLNKDIEGADNSDADHVQQVIDWDCPGGAFL